MRPDKALTLADFLESHVDREKREYEIQHVLNTRYHAAFRDYRLYPQLAELTSLLEHFSEIFAACDSLESRMPKRLFGVDVEKRRLLFEILSQRGDDMIRVFDLIEWALPRIELLVERGVKIFEYAEEHISIDVVGIMPVRRTGTGRFFPARIQSRQSTYIHTNAPYASRILTDLSRCR